MILPQQNSDQNIAASFLDFSPEMSYQLLFCSIVELIVHHNLDSDFMKPLTTHGPMIRIMVRQQKSEYEGSHGLSE
jgi:hypothetical protein